MNNNSTYSAELLAPAGNLEAAYAAFHYGADAVYAGLQQFSARAEADNFTPDQLNTLTAYAHEMGKKVYVTINTLIQNSELKTVIHTLGTASDIGVDAIILQDLGIYHLIKQHVPNLRMHASTQLAIHNLSGVLTAQRLGFKRVTLARELTLKEVHNISSNCDIETEVFIHGALCYAYSGLCLYSSMLRNRSGNRGRCNYPCRDLFEDNSQSTHPFSMKDLALSDHIQELKQCGAVSFKIEGRKKNPLYVAATTNYYRGLLDNSFSRSEAQRCRDDIQTIFSRPLTELYVETHKTNNVTDTNTVGHRGIRIGRVERIQRNAYKRYELIFTTSHAIERHDGIQIDVPSRERPFGFSAQKLYDLTSNNKRTSVFEAKPRSKIAVELPEDYPQIPVGAPVYCSSSQAVQRRYSFDKPRPGHYKKRIPISIKTGLQTDAINTTYTFEVSGCTINATTTFSQISEPDQLKKPEAFESAVTRVFGKTGPTPFETASLTITNPQSIFVPVSVLNEVRRKVFEDAGKSLKEAIEQRDEQVLDKLTTINHLGHPWRDESKDQGTPIWSIKIDDLNYLNAFSKDDVKSLDEVIIDIGGIEISDLQKTLRDIDHDKIRLALPIITRQWEETDLYERIDTFIADGWKRWEISNLSGFDFLGFTPGSIPNDWDISADWPIYITNVAAIKQWAGMGLSGLTLSPDDNLENMISLQELITLPLTTIIYQDTPLFISENCAFKSMTGECSNKAGCKEERIMGNRAEEHIRIINRNCRTIVVSKETFSRTTQIPQLKDAELTRFRIDFMYRGYTPAEIRKTLSGFLNLFP